MTDDPIFDLFPQFSPHQAGSCGHGNTLPDGGPPNNLHPVLHDIGI